MEIVYNSFDGRFSDSPRALYQALASDPGLTHTWLAAPAQRWSFPQAARTATPGSAAAVEALERADLVVSNTHLPRGWVKKPGARYLQTWHGTPLKHIAGDEPSVGPADPVPGWEDVARWDLLLAPSAVTVSRLARAFRYGGPVAATGLPRNDVLRSPVAGLVRERVRAHLGLDAGVTAVLYTPTWRDDVLDDAGRRDVRLQLDLADVRARLGKDHVLLLRLHYMVSDRLGPLDAPGVIDVSSYPDVAELYLAADAMVTDYSSTMFDFAVTGKPLLFFAYDLDHFRDDLRGFYLDFPREAPGPVLSTSAEVLQALADPVASTAAWAERYAGFRAEFCHLDDGHATERVLGLLLADRSLRVHGPLHRPVDALVDVLPSARTGGLEAAAVTW